ncbi:hypothetical protein FEAC_26450 [Ferrimicrobium acidiphilum DSM 19497]|uniref:Uncharacterized protein n=1 Tax=Ferrimicrobium acidiphilum DSM 19497 TaxID=1121877 RepID=A0A0D8FTN8_9ACTN|nr:hypothetical protein FEAC_26450 [Ferrimicrobium acidiphilum DSM 19497]
MPNAVAKITCAVLTTVTLATNQWFLEIEAGDFSDFVIVVPRK